MKNHLKLFTLTLITLLCFSSCCVFTSSGKISPVSYTSKIDIECNDYISGVQSIDVYSGLTVQDYAMYLNGTMLRNESNPIVGRKGYWNATYMRVGIGENVVGNISSLESADTNYFSARGQTFLFWDFLQVEISFSTMGLGFSPNSIVVSNLAFLVNTTNTDGGIDLRNMQFYNTTSSSWQTFYTLPSSGVTTQNMTMDVKNNIRPLTNDFAIRFDMRDAANQFFTINASYITIYYESSLPVEGHGDYVLVDSFMFDSTTFSDGVYNLTVEINGTAAGNVTIGTYTEMKWVIIDNTLPVIDDIDITPGTLKSGEKIKINTTVFDVNLESDHGEIVDVLGNTLIYENGNNEIFNYEAFFANGTYDFYVFAHDLAGNFAYKSISFDVSLTLKNVYFPSVIIGYDTIGYNITMDFASNNTSKLELKKEGILNATIAGNTTDTVDLVNLDYGVHNFTVDVYDAFDVLYASIEIDINVTGVSSIYKIIRYPYVSLSYPVFVIAGEIFDMVMETDFSSGFQLETRVNGTLISSDFYAGNASHAIVIPSDYAGSIMNYSFEIFDDTNSSFSNVTIEILVVSRANLTEVLAVEYTIFAFENSYLTINGSATFQFDVDITHLGVSVYQGSGVTGFSYRYNTTYTTTLAFKIEIRRGGVLVYLRNLEIPVLKQPVSGNPFLLLTVSDYWLFFLIAIAAVFIFIYYYYSRKKEKSSNARSVSTPGAKPDARKSNSKSSPINRPGVYCKNRKL